MLMSQTSEVGPSRTVEVANYCSFCGYKFLVNDNRCTNCGKLRLIKRSAPTGKWQRVLYEKPAFDDNYVDATFLNTVKYPPKPPRLLYSELFLSSIELSLAIAAITLFLVCYHYMSKKTIGNEFLIGVHFVFLLMGSFLMIIFSPKMTKLKKIAHHMKGGVLVLGTLLMLSPVIRTFYSNYAENTTYALACFLIVVHLVCRDYGYVYPEAGTDINMDTSTYAALYLSVILGSRLDDAMSVFALWVIDMTLFIFLRVVLKALRSFSSKAYYYLAFSVILVMLLPLYTISKMSIIVYILVNFLVLVVSPIALMWFYQYKNVIEGPWDLPNIQKHDDED